MSLQTKKLTNSCNRVAVKHQPSGVFVRAPKASGFGQEFLKSVKNLQSEYNAQLKYKDIKRENELRNFQWSFWKRKATEVHAENAKVFVLLSKSRASFKPNATKMCWEKMIYFYMLLNLLNRDVRTDIADRSANKSELTVLISVDAIQKYRCRKFLKDWKVETSKKQPPVSGRRQTPREKLNQTETMITHHVREFLKLVYEHAKERNNKIRS